MTMTGTPTAPRIEAETPTRVRAILPDGREVVIRVIDRGTGYCVECEASGRLAVMPGASNTVSLEVR